MAHNPFVIDETLELKRNRSPVAPKRPLAGTENQPHVLLMSHFGELGTIYVINSSKYCKKCYTINKTVSGNEHARREIKFQKRITILS